MTRRWWAIAAVAVTAMSAPAQAAPESCQIFYWHDKKVEEAMGESPYDFEGFDMLCRFLKQRNLRVVIQGDSGVLSNRSYSWAYVKLSDRRTFVESLGSTSSTTVDLDASTPAAREGLKRATNRALQVLATNPQHLAELAGQVVSETARLRRLLVEAPAS